MLDLGLLFLNRMKEEDGFVVILPMALHFLAQKKG